MNDETEIRRQVTSLRDLTTARVELGLTGTSLPTRHHLAFQLAHAQARDAVYAKLSVHSLTQELKEFGHPVFAVRSAARDRQTYLRRPDLGRILSPESEALLLDRTSHGAAVDVVFVIADGLSATAIERHAVPLLRKIFSILSERSPASEWKIGPLCVLEQGRVAAGDVIGAALRAAMVVVLIGERPGLSSPDSLGTYLTWNPKLGRSDAERNCISNIRADGLSYSAAAEKIAYLMRESRTRKLSGIALKEAEIAALDSGLREL